MDISSFKLYNSHIYWYILLKSAKYSNLNYNHPFFTNMYPSVQAARHCFSNIGQRLSPYYPVVVRLLVVSTFIEDGVSVVLEFDHELNFLHRQFHLPYFIAAFLLISYILISFAAALMIVSCREKNAAFRRARSSGMHFIPADNLLSTYSNSLWKCRLSREEPLFVRCYSLRFLRQSSCGICIAKFISYFGND